MTSKKWQKLYLSELWSQDSSSSHAPPIFLMWLEMCINRMKSNTTSIMSVHFSSIEHYNNGDFFILAT